MQNYGDRTHIILNGETKLTLHFSLSHFPLLFPIIFVPLIYGLGWSENWLDSPSLVNGGW